MLVTKHAAELCALLVNDLLGELSSRILLALFTKGRANLGQLAQYTSLNTRYLRNGLGILIQHSLLYTRTDPASGQTVYEANAATCYNLIRHGRIMDVVLREFGPSERDLVQSLLLLGHTRIHDLVQAFSLRNHGKNGRPNGLNGTTKRLIESEHDVHTVLSRLMHAGIVETVCPDSFRNPLDAFHEIRNDVMYTGPGEKVVKQKDEHKAQIAARYTAFRDQGEVMKRQLDSRRGPSVKRRKLANGLSANNDFDDEDDVSPLSVNLIVRVNHEKCLVELRNQRLAEFAADAISEATGEVYRTLLGMLTSRISRCRGEPLIAETVPAPHAPVTTLEIFEHLDESVPVQRGIGRAAEGNIDAESAEKLRLKPYRTDGDDSDDSDSGLPNHGTSGTPSRGRVRLQLDDDDSDASDDVMVDGGRSGNHKRRSAPSTNGDRESKVQFEEEKPTKEIRLNQMRQHLLLLSESKYRFIRHCGTQGHGQWTVDFDVVLDRVRESELDAIIEQSFGRHGLRLTRILRERGKLDEKMLHSAALMKKPDVQGKMLAMQMAGLVDVQEVPKDGSRMANRTLFFWFFDSERTQAQLLDDVYKAMLRCLQTLHVERHKERNILSFVERKDVQGKEEEVMTAEHYNKYNRHLEQQDRLLGQLMRLDDIVSTFRDF